MFFLELFGVLDCLLQDVVVFDQRVRELGRELVDEIGLDATGLLNELSGRGGAGGGDARGGDGRGADLTMSSVSVTARLSPLSSVAYA